jgi:hypothetical protein
MKRVVLEFFGGCWNGRSLDSGSSDAEERKLAHGYYFKTEDGTIGHGIKELSPQAHDFARKHGWEDSDEPGYESGENYQVVEKVDEAERMVVKFRHHASV